MGFGVALRTAQGGAVPRPGKPRPYNAVITRIAILCDGACVGAGLARTRDRSALRRIRYADKQYTDKQYTEYNTPMPIRLRPTQPLLTFSTTRGPKTGKTQSESC